MSYFCDKAIFILSVQLEIIFCLFVNTNIRFFAIQNFYCRKLKL